MTTPPTEQLRPSPPQRYEELSREHFRKAEDALATSDALAASEQIWSAVANALKAVCQQRGWNHRYHNHLRACAYYLAVEQDRPDFNAAFRSVQDLHTNNYEHQEFAEDVEPVLDQAQLFCQALERIGRASPPAFDDFPPEKRANLENRLVELNRPLPPDVAFGPQFTNEELENLPSVRPPHTREVNR